jgi:hypothetical protein
MYLRIIYNIQHLSVYIILFEASFIFKLIFFICIFFYNVNIHVQYDNFTVLLYA